MTDAGYDVEPVEMDLSSRESILAMIKKAQEFGEIKYLVNGAGVSPSQAPIEAILKEKAGHTRHVKIIRHSDLSDGESCFEETNRKND